MGSNPDGPSDRTARRWKKLRESAATWLSLDACDRGMEDRRRAQRALLWPV
jgi:hypothetical protein